MCFKNKMKRKEKRQGPRQGRVVESRETGGASAFVNVPEASSWRGQWGRPVEQGGSEACQGVRTSKNVGFESR